MIKMDIVTAFKRMDRAMKKKTIAAIAPNHKNGHGLYEYATGNLCILGAAFTRKELKIIKEQDLNDSEWHKLEKIISLDHPEYSRGLDRLQILHDLALGSMRDKREEKEAFVKYYEELRDKVLAAHAEKKADVSQSERKMLLAG